MREFLKGWRRKTGCVTLVLACVFLCAWMRSLNPHLPSLLPRQFVFDRENWEFGYSIWRVDHTVDRFYLKESWMVWETVHADAPVMVNNVIAVWVNATDTNVPDLEVGNKAWKFNRQWCGFGVGEYHFNEGRYNLHLARVLFPYWAIILPLTLLSAWLLLSKPRTSTPQKTVEPIPGDGR